MAALQACAAVPNVNEYLRSQTRCNGTSRCSRRSDGPLVFGNQTQLLKDGGQAFPAMFHAMQQARDHINLEYFIFEDVAWAGSTSPIC